MSRNPFQATGDAKVRRSGFDLSCSQLTSQKFGELVPLAPIEVLPGDVFTLGLSSFIRAQLLVRPPIGRTKLRTYTFFIPYRILWDDWATFIGGQEDYDPDVPYVAPDLPYMPVDASAGGDQLAVLGSLWDYFGFPLGPNSDTTLDVYNPASPNSYKAMTFPWDAYWLTYNEYFRVPGIQPKLIPDWSASANPAYEWQYKPAYRNHTRDYFTASLPWTQRGAPPALPVFGSATAEFDLPFADYSGASQNEILIPGARSAAAVGDPLGVVAGSSAAAGPNSVGFINSNSLKPRYDAWLSDNNVVAAGTFSSVDINDLRLAIQTQVFLERQARGGARYTEVIQSHFGVYIPDERLFRPLFIGGTVSDILFSEIPQTSATTGSDYQGNLAGTGVGADQQRIGKFRAVEHGIILTLVNITVDSVYSQGFPRSFSRRLQLDFPWPEFVGLGEQEVFNYEVFAGPADDLDLDPFGYTGRYNECRYLPNVVSGQLRPFESQKQWTQARQFDSRPTLSSGFIATASESANDGAWMRPFAVTNPDTTPPFVAHYARQIEAFRPLPYLAEPSAIVGG